MGISTAVKVNHSLEVPHEVGSQCEGRLSCNTKEKTVIRPLTPDVRVKSSTAV
jgi:hypothetical protein